MNPPRAPVTRAYSPVAVARIGVQYRASAPTEKRQTTLRVTLTGGTGFLGLRLIRELVNRNCSVTLLSRRGSTSSIDRISHGLQLLSETTDFIHKFRRLADETEIEIEQPLFGLPDDALEKLVRRTDMFFHSAGNIDLNTGARSIRPVNVDGTRNFLDIASRSPYGAPFCHVSTAFVAGSRRSGRVYEADLNDTHGFENEYERSKCDAEALVHRWARDNGMPALIMRPSILLTDRSPVSGLPAHPFQTISGLLRASTIERGIAGLSIPRGLRPVIHMVGRPDARLNCLPVEDAASAIVRIAAEHGTTDVATHHIVHPENVSAETLIELFEKFAPIRIKLASALPERLSPAEQRFHSYAGFSAYFRHTRVYDDRNTRRVLGSACSQTPVDMAYLLSGTYAIR
ncbi:SDR family oxidoreductase [Streptomyces sp. SID3343]|uniref:SDR family oxidoreductase n=1 Tax=Streptomyces sp. SID3343 TaxID=2690260 RepID=UPI0013697C8C|nr:SDR family oxidoreductase [Streptomyces sp. SID3343]